MNQIEWELKHSQENIHKTLKYLIQDQFDKYLSNWALGTYVRLIDYLSTRSYDSKNTRKQELKVWLEDNSMDDLIATVLVAVIQDRKDQPLQVAVGYLANKMPHENVWDNVKTASELIALGQSNHPDSLYKITRNEAGKPLLSSKYWHFLEDTFGEAYSNISPKMFNPPLIDRPLVVTDNRSAGYHTFRVPLILGQFTHHDYPLDYVSINTLNDIKWVLDPDVLNEAEESPSPLDSTDKVSQFTKLVNDSASIYKDLKDKPFHLVWQYDSRGRLYSHGYHVNLQSYEYKKALLSFEKEEYLT